MRFKDPGIVREWCRWGCVRQRSPAFTRLKQCRCPESRTVGIDDVVCAKRRKRGAAAAKTTVPLGLRWAIERTNSWLSNFGQLRRNTDRRPRHRLAQLALAIALLLTAKLIDWRNRWSPR